MNSKNSLTSMKKLLFALYVLASIPPALAQQGTPHTSFKPGGEWLDTDGKHIDCHGGNIIYVDSLKTYYWYGEHRGQPRGASCYSSQDLYN